MPMDGASFGLHDAAIGVHAGHVVEQRYLLPDDAHAGGIEPLQRRIERRRNDFIQPVERQSLGKAETQTGERGRLERHKLLTRHDGIGFGAIGDAAGQRPDGIERIAQRKCALGGDALPARLEADDAAERRRNAHRAAGIGPDGDLAHAVAGRDRGAGERTAGHAGTVGQIGRRAEMRIGADGAERESRSCWSWRR